MSSDLVVTNLYGEEVDYYRQILGVTEDLVGPTCINIQNNQGTFPVHLCLGDTYRFVDGEEDNE